MAKRIGKYKISKREAELSAVDGATISGNLDGIGTLGVNGAITAASTLAVTGAQTNTAGQQNAAVAVVATADGTGTGTIPAGTSVASVACGAAARIVILPAPVIGNIIILIETATTGYELRSSAPGSIGINGGTGSNVESAVAGAITYTRCVCVSATNWICNTFDADGDEAKLEAAA